MRSPRFVNQKRMRDMIELVPKDERKTAFLWLLGLAAFIAVVCSIQLPTHNRLPTREYLDDVALANLFGAMAGAVLWSIWSLGATVAHLIGARFVTRPGSRTEIEEV
jgi:hypothetical protein